MPKQIWKPATILNPLPVVMVSCKNKEVSNIITIAWAGTINSEPPMLSISVRKERFSYDIIKESGEFVVNLVSRELGFAADFCGVKSGRDVDKFKEMKLTKEEGEKVRAPLIMESPINIECAVKDVLELGSHDMFIAEVLAVHVDERLLDERGGLRIQDAELLCFSHGKYWNIGDLEGYFGFSVTKKKNLKRKDIREFKKGNKSN